MEERGAKIAVPGHADEPGSPLGVPIM